MKRLLMILCAVCVATSQGRAQSPGDRMPISPPPEEIDQDALKAFESGTRGSLAIHVVQGTKDGPEIGALKFEVDLVHREHVLRTLTGTLSDRGLGMVENIPIGLPIRPVVRVKYANATYQDVAPQMDQSHTRASIDLTVYEATDQEPAWKFKQRTLAIAPLPGELDIVETVDVENPEHRTWMGAPPDGAGRRATVRIPIVKGAREIELDAGFHGWCCSAVQDDVLVVQMPLMPGAKSFRFGYRVSVDADPMEVRATCTRPCDVLTVLVPMEGVNAKAIALMNGEPRLVGGMRVRTFEGFGVQAGTSAGVLLSALEAPKPPPVAAMPAARPHVRRSWWESASAPVVIAVGVGVVIVGGAILLYLKPPAGKPGRRKAPLG